MDQLKKKIKKEINHEEEEEEEETRRNRGGKGGSIENIMANSMHKWDILVSSLYSVYFSIVLLHVPLCSDAKRVDMDQLKTSTKTLCTNRI